MPKANAPSLPFSTRDRRSPNPGRPSHAFRGSAASLACSNRLPVIGSGGSVRARPDHHEPHGLREPRPATASGVDQQQAPRRVRSGEQLDVLVRPPVSSAGGAPGAVSKVMHRLAGSIHPPRSPRRPSRQAACRPSVGWGRQIRCTGRCETVLDDGNESDRNHMRKREVIRFQSCGCQHCSGGSVLKRTMCERLWLVPSGNNTHPKPCAIPLASANKDRPLRPWLLPRCTRLATVPPYEQPVEPPTSGSTTREGRVTGRGEPRRRTPSGVGERWQAGPSVRSCTTRSTWHQSRVD